MPLIDIHTRRPLATEHSRELPEGVGGAAWIMLFAALGLALYATLIWWAW